MGLLETVLSAAADGASLACRVRLGAAGHGAAGFFSGGRGSEWLRADGLAADPDVRVDPDADCAGQRISSPSGEVIK